MFRNKISSRFFRISRRELASNYKDEDEEYSDEDLDEDLDENTK